MYVATFAESFVYVTSVFDAPTLAGRFAVKTAASIAEPSEFSIANWMAPQSNDGTAFGAFASVHVMVLGGCHTSWVSAGLMKMASGPSIVSTQGSWKSTVN